MKGGKSAVAKKWGIHPFEEGAGEMEKILFSIPKDIEYTLKYMEFTPVTPKIPPLRKRTTNEIAQLPIDIEQIIKNAKLDQEERKVYKEPVKLSKAGLHTALKRIGRFKTPRPYNERVGLATNLMRTAQEIGHLNTIKHIAPLIETLSKDQEEIRKIVISQVVEVGAYMRERPEGYECIGTQIVPVIESLALDPLKEISDTSTRVLVQLSQMLTIEDRGKWVLTFVLRLAHDDADKDARIAAVQLLNILAPFLGRELCEEFVALEIISLSEDYEYQVRKATAENFVKVCETVGLEYFKKKLLNIYSKLAKDSICWVRKAAAEILVEIATVCLPEIRATTLVSTFNDFMNDPTKWVKKAAYEQLGPFICTLSGTQISESLISSYNSMALLKSGIGGDEMAYHCAYHFPGVLSTIGPKNWAKLKLTYHKLCQNNGKKVKMTLACSIHEIARLVGPEIAKEELVPIVLSILRLKGTEKEKEKEKRLPILQGCLKYLHEFMAALLDEDRLQFFEVIMNIVSLSGYKWRLRAIVAKHLGDYTEILSDGFIYTKFSGLAFKLCGDSVYDVRMQAATQMVSLLRKVQENEAYLVSMTNHIHLFATSPKFTERQVFAKICGSLLKHPEIFIAYFLKGFLSIIKDPISSVRMSAVQTINTHRIQNILETEDSSIIDLITHLSRDMDKSVRLSIKRGSIGEDYDLEIRPDDLIDEDEGYMSELQVEEDELEEGEEKMRQESKKMVLNMKIDEIEGVDEIEERGEPEGEGWDEEDEDS